jgi:hypothetical protein
MDKQHRIDFPVWNYTVHVVYTDDIRKARQARVSIVGALEEPLHEFIDAMHCYNPVEPDGIIFITPTTSAGVICHEAFHAMWRMFKWTGAKPENETYAYHLGYLVDKILDQKKKWDKE